MDLSVNWLRSCLMGNGNSHVGLLMAMRCWTGVVKSTGIGGYVAPAATPRANKGSPLTKVRRVSIMMPVLPTPYPLAMNMNDQKKNPQQPWPE